MYILQNLIVEFDLFHYQARHCYARVFINICNLKPVACTILLITLVQLREKALTWETNYFNLQIQPVIKVCMHHFLRYHEKDVHVVLTISLMLNILLIKLKYVL